MRIADIQLDHPLVLAPMAGVTDPYFRLIARRIGGVGIVTMEFVASKGLVNGDPVAERIMVFAEEERPLSIQIYGSHPDTMAEAARIVEEAGADLCDINMGCPANKVLKGCAGAALMGDLDLAERIIARVRAAISIPLTVKFRRGLDERRESYLELAKICEAHGVDAVAMHGRTARQAFQGEVCLESIARLKEHVSIPVLGNGDIETAEDALRMLRKTGCDGVMIGRGATRNPWIFRQIAAHLTGDRQPEPSLEDRRRLILDHFRAVIDGEEEIVALHKLRVFIKWYSRGLPEGHRLRRRINEWRTAEQVIEEFEDFFTELGAREAA